MSNILGCTFCVLIFLSFGSTTKVDFKNGYNYVDILGGVRQKIQYAKYSSRLQQKTSLNGLFHPKIINILQKGSDLLSQGSASPKLQAFTLSQTCMNQTQIFIEGALNGEEWALRMLDSVDKMPSGILDGNVIWYGSYDECIRIRAPYPISENSSNPDEPRDIAYQAKYCQMTIPLDDPIADGGNRYDSKFMSIRLGMCFPEGCSTADTRSLVGMVLDLLPLGNLTLRVTGGSCKLTDKQMPEWKDSTIAMICVCGSFAALMLIATLFDYIFIQWPKAKQEEAEKEREEEETCIMEVDDGTTVTQFPTDEEKKPLIGEEPKQHWKPYKPGILGNLLLSFSVYTNGSKLLNTKQTAGTLTAVNGIRFLSMNWVILGHTFSTGVQRTENLADIYPRKMNQWTFMAIANADVSVDSFFTLSGLLVAFLTLKEMKKKGGAHKINWIMYYFHRFWRLSPPYMMCIGIQIAIFHLLSDGPFWNQIGGNRNCEENWWTNLLYVNNLVNDDKQCYGVGWYLANDMQFYWVTPLLLIPLFYSASIGLAWNLIVMVGSFITIYVVSATLKMPPSSFGGGENPDAGDFSRYYYRKPWCRIGPYIVGMLMGYILYKTDCKVKMNKLMNMFGWLIATCAACFVLYCLADSLNGNTLLSVEVSALYNALHRSVWAAALCWVIFACATGNGGIVNILLSWNGIVPLSRLTYCAFLIHPQVQSLYTLSLRRPLYWNDLTVSFLFLGFLVLSYAAAFVISMAFEAPAMGLEKVIFRRGNTK